MRVEGLALQLRPRSMMEAADLGVVLVHRNARSIWRCWAPVFGATLLLVLATIEVHPALPGFLLLWLKPWLDRSLMFVLSRAVFGQETRWADVWAQRGPVFGRQWLSALTLRRLSPWRSYTQPIYQLEGQRGKARRARRAQVLRGKRGAAGGMHFIFANIEGALVIAGAAVILLFAPEGMRGDFMRWLREGSGIASNLAITLLYGAVVFVLEPFYVAAGFAMYLNRRVELEAWDVEQEFRRDFST